MVLTQKCNKPSSETVLKAAVNAFHQSVGLVGPYNVDICPAWPLKVSCRLPGNRDLQTTGKSVLIFDIAASSRLQTAIATIPVLDNGTALPHVNIEFEPSLIEWFLIGSKSQDVPQEPYAYVWFMVDEVIRDLFELLASCRGLMPARSKGMVSFQNSIASLPSGKEISVTAMVMQPGSLIVTWLPHEPKLLEKTSNTSSGMLTSCIMDTKCLTDLRHVGDTSTMMDMDHHTVMNGFPQPYLEALSQFQQSSLPQHYTKTLEMDKLEVTIKEEPLNDTCVKATHSKEIMPAPEPPSDKHATSTLGQSQEVIRHSRKRQYHISKHFGTLLQCPKCCASFKSGFQGQGMGNLMKHVYDSHRRLISHCTLQIQRKYADIFKDLK